MPEEVRSLTCQVQAKDTPQIVSHGDQGTLDAVAEGIVKSFVSSHVTGERADAVKQAFEGVLLVR